MECISPLLAAGSIGDFLRTQRVPFCGCELDSATVLILTAIIHAAFLFAMFGLVPFFFIWLERKVAGRIQDRLGPTRVGGRFGWLQSLADGVKLIQKEDLVPSMADGLLFRMAPYIACVATFGAFMVLPFSDGWSAVASDVGLFVLFAILSIEVVGIILAGYSSGSKWSLFGGMREAAQMVSYEIPLAICGLIPVLAVGSLNLTEIGQVQSGWFLNWLVFNSPFTFLAFWVYFTVSTASCKRAPFDLAEAESELVGGFHTEYSGMRWSFFFMAEYASMFLVSLVASLLFLGGWHTGIAPLDSVLTGLRETAAASPGFHVAGYVANLFGMMVLASKGAMLVFVQIWLRWTLPRLRIDQVMTTCLKYLVPMSCGLFLCQIIWPLVVISAVGRSTLVAWPEEMGGSIGERMGRQSVTRPVETDESAGQPGDDIDESAESSPESLPAVTESQDKVSAGSVRPHSVRTAARD
ncbi:MAG: NADH-quinone oxidoreductase subunit H [Planctomycetaceae bacterium]|nr:NADH-quinone oxidoreductase subunit H [Planctomycetaceae bacterium]